MKTSLRNPDAIINLRFKPYTIALRGQPQRIRVKRGPAVERLREDIPRGIIAGMKDPLPLPTMLSQALVAFTIEFDNESERQIHHRTTRHGSKGGSTKTPWLVSLVFWSGLMQFVPDEGITVRDLYRRTRLTVSDLRFFLTRLSKWWGYLAIRPDPADSRPDPPRAERLVRPTPGGRQALEVWRPLLGVIEKRWQERFGKRQIEQLRKSLWAVAIQFDVELPDSLPILGYGLSSKEAADGLRPAARRDDRAASEIPLPSLLSRVLLAFAIEFERESDLSLAISANVARVLDDIGVRVRDLPLLTGVSKEAIAMATGFLGKRGLAVIETDPAGSRAKLVRLTPKGLKAQDAYRRLLGAVEDRWLVRYGKEKICALRETLETLVGDGTAAPSPLFRGLEPYPDGWRASVRKPTVLPHYPMILHRGGFPDGS